MIKNVKSVSDFEKMLSENKKIIVDFYADWCGPCKMLSPVLEKVSTDNKDYFFAKVNVDELSELAEKYQVASIPTLIIFEDKNEVKRNTGFLSESKLLTFLN